MRAREVYLAHVPDDQATANDFAVRDAQVPDPVGDQVLVGLRLLGLNAGLASRMGAPGTSYGPGIDVGDIPTSDAVVEVLADSGDLRTGDLAIRKGPWRTVDVCDPAELRRLPDLGAPLEAYLTILGHVGFTAWTGMMHVGHVSSTDTVYVSAAAGGVGSCAVQFAKAVGATVIGLVGSPEKAELITGALGADAAINRRDGDPLEQLRAAAPNGIDLYYDNVGGPQLAAALQVLTTGGRVVICGQVAGPGTLDLRSTIYRELTIRGVAVTAHEDLRPQFEKQVGGWLKDGTVQSLHTVFEGIDEVGEAFATLLAGHGQGRILVRMT
jgi:NADPH-dependent curcumin reductase CurA